MYKIIFALSIYTLSYIGTYTRSAFEYLTDKNSIYALFAYELSKSNNANSKLLTLCYNDVISIHCVNSAPNVHRNFQFSIFNFQFASAHSVNSVFSNTEK